MCLRTYGRILIQVDIEVTLKPRLTLSLLFCKLKDVINFEHKRVLVYQISCWDCSATYVDETGRSVRTRNMLMQWLALSVQVKHNKKLCVAVCDLF